MQNYIWEGGRGGATTISLPIHLKILVLMFFSATCVIVEIENI